MRCASPMSWTIMLVAALVAASPQARSTESLYVLDTVGMLPSTDTDWDYIKLEPSGSRLFMARRNDGLTVYDVDRQKVVGQVENSRGANGPLLLPAFNRAYVAMTDGSLLSFELDSLEVLDRTRLASDGGLNAVVFDPATARIHAIVGSRPTESTWFTLDAATGESIGVRVFPFRKMDDPAPDGKGHLFAPARYDNLLLKLDSQTLDELDRWALDCKQVVAVEYQVHTDRLMVGCRGDEPVFLALDARTGRQLARIPIGRGIDGMAIDEGRHRILTMNGVDASLTVIGQDGPDVYRLLGNVQTRPQARVMQLDARTGRVFTVTADATFPPPGADGKVPPPVFHRDSFVVLTYRPE